MINTILIILLWNCLFKKGNLHCGIIGYCGPKDSKLNIDKIKMLLFANQERGKDSLGYYTPESGIIKDLGKAEDVISKKDFTIPESNVFIGHVRSKTVGVVSLENAHPFNYGNIVLAMNGTLSNHWDLAREYKLPMDEFSVDTQVLTAMLNAKQNKEPLSQIIGGCAILYTDTNTGKVYCYRNNGRPLYRGMHNQGMYISSTDISLKMIGCTDVKEFKENTLYEIDNGVIKNFYKVKQANEANYRPMILSKTISFNQLKSDEICGMYWEPIRDHNDGKGGIFKKGYRYLFVEAHPQSHYEVEAVDHEGKKVTTSKYYFKEEQPIISIKDHVMLLFDITYNGKEKLVFGKFGDICIVTNITPQNITCKNILTKNSAVIERDSVRYATDNEVLDFTTLNKTGGSFDFSSLEDAMSQESNNSETKEEIYRKQVYATEHDRYSDLVDFTIDEILDKISDMDEILSEKSKNALRLVNNIKTVINNYTVKSIELLKREELNEEIDATKQ